MDEKKHRIVSLTDHFTDTVNAAVIARVEVGWNLAVPSIGVDTRWGVPRYDAEHEAVNYTCDHNRLTAIRYPTFTGNDVRYTYGRPGARHNGAGRVIEVRDATGRPTREYGQLGEFTEETRRVEVRHLDSRTYRYDGWNRMLQMTFPDGEVLSYGYDSGGRVISADGVKRGHRYRYLARQQYDKFGRRILTELGNGTVPATPMTSPTAGSPSRKRRSRRDTPSRSCTTSTTTSATSRPSRTRRPGPRP